MSTESSTVSTTTSKNKKRALAMGALAGLMAISGTFAFFTDRMESSASATAGTVDLALDANWSDVANFNPGDMANLGYTITNEGNKSVDVRERIVLKSDVAMDTATQAEFEIYRAADVEQDAAGACVPKAGAEPITTGEDRVVSADGTSITYELDQYTLNGVGTSAEEEDGISATSNESEYVLVFKGAADNDFQGANVNVKLVAEAKQHRNTDDNTWASVATEQIQAGGIDLNVVPER